MYNIILDKRNIVEINISLLNILTVLIHPVVCRLPMSLLLTEDRLSVGEFEVYILCELLGPMRSNSDEIYRKKVQLIKLHKNIYIYM